MTIQNDFGLSVVIQELARHGGGGFEWYKDNCLLRRVEIRMRARGASSLVAYAGILATDSEEVEHLLHTLSVRVTGFFRNPDSWRFLRDQLASERLGERGRMTAWSMGCATGEEAWSIAMLLCEHARHFGAEPSPDFRVFASDVDTQGLGVAQTGRYPESAVAAIREVVPHPYGSVESGKFVVDSELRRKVTFCHEDLTAEATAPEPCDLVCCRNLLIFLGREGQRRVLEAARHSMRPNGLLMLGRTESMVALSAPGLVPVDPFHRIYRRAS
jgi:two-component system CheB/CheR fusion protein